MQLNELLETQVRGKRLSQVAGNCIDLVDRNLYERSCDVRWWATESAVVNALAHPDEESLNAATERMATILQSYTVYFDLVLCDREGRVLCNGNPAHFSSRGMQMESTSWFRAARKSISGNQFGYAGPLRSELADNNSALIYSCAVRRDGKNNGDVLGVLGVIFDWDRFSREILKRAETMLNSESIHEVHAYLCTPEGQIIATSSEGKNHTHLEISDLAQVRTHKDHFNLQTVGSVQKLIGYAPSPGYETYSSGWIAVVVETRT